MRNFGKVLTDMERRGIRVDAKDYLAGVEVQAREDRKGHVEAFHKWAFEMIGVDGLAINPGQPVLHNCVHSSCSVGQRIKRRK